MGGSRDSRPKKTPQNHPAMKPRINTIPSGVTRVIFLLLQKILAERDRTIKTAPAEKGLSLWLTRDGDLIYKRKKSSRRISATTLLIHDFDDDKMVSKGGLLHRVIEWISRGHFAALAENLSPVERIACFKEGFFRQIEDPTGEELGKEALIADVRARLEQRTRSSGPLSET